MENLQVASHFLMIRPIAEKNILQEFDGVVDILRKQGVQVLVVEDATTSKDVKSMATSNWLSTLADGQVVIYPLSEPTLRLGRIEQVLSQLDDQFIIKQYHHFEQYETNNRYLEGSASVVYDHTNKVAYACTSKRTDATLLNKLCKEIGYQPASFRATDMDGHEIEHTNNMMMVGDEFVIVCLEAVQDGADELLLNQFLRTTKKTIIEISIEQMYAFAGNMLQVAAEGGTKFTLMSESAKKALSSDQIDRIQSYNTILSVSIPLIEHWSHESVRSIMTEIFLVPKS